MAIISLKREIEAADAESARGRPARALRLLLGIDGFARGEGRCPHCWSPLDDGAPYGEALREHETAVHLDGPEAA